MVKMNNTFSNLRKVCYRWTVRVDHSSQSSLLGRSVKSGSHDRGRLVYNAQGIGYRRPARTAYRPQPQQYRNPSDLPASAQIK